MVFELQAELGDSPFVVSSLGTAPVALFASCCANPASPPRMHSNAPQLTARLTSRLMCTYEWGFKM